MSVLTQLAVASIEPTEINISRRADELRERKPTDVNSDATLKDRRTFLRESLGTEGADTFERVINGDELQPVSYLTRGAIAARAVARIELRGGQGGYGTGFLIAPNLLITNNHVLPTAAIAASAMVQFSYEVNLDDAPIFPVNFRTDSNTLFFTSKELDFSIVAVEGTAEGGGIKLDEFGCLPLLDVTGKASDGEWLTIIQHPDGARKQVCVRDNQLLERGDNVLWYTTDTKPGSSGSPVFNNDWYVVALHHKGIPETKNGVIQTVDGRDYDAATMAESRVKWIANEGVRASRIVQALKAANQNHPLLAPLYNATPASARIGEPKTASPRLIASPKESAIVSQDRAAAFPIEVCFQVFADGRVVPGGNRSVASAESFVIAEEAAKKAKKAARFDAPFDDDYSKRKGFQADFLGGGAKSVSLPELTDALAEEAAPLIKPVGTNKHVLHYHNFSVVMHATRRLAIYSAANVSFANRYEMSRPSDVWRRDPRILAKYQVEGWYYAANNFDRGHLTRREDLEFGPSPIVALQSAADTCHWTNCAPQHSRFNQNKEIWQGIERYILEESIFNGNVNAQIFTGPVLDAGDPEYKKIPYPLQYWKVVAALDGAGDLFATAYIASQEEVIAQYGIEVTEVPFGAYKTFQTSVVEIERLTGLKFWCGAAGKKALSGCDPLSGPPSTRRRRRRRAMDAQESTTATALPANYFEITDLDDIQLSP